MMNLSSGSRNVTSVSYRDSFTDSLIKNVVTVALGVSINYINATMIHTFTKQHILKTNPRYMLFIHLVANDMIQLTISISLFVFTYTFYTINVTFCIFLLLPAIFTTQNTPLNLACMAGECYIAICVPLRHAQICTVKRTYVAIGVIWVMSALSILPDVFISVATEPSAFFHSRVFCNRDELFRNAYSQAKRDVSHITFLVIVWLTLFYTYFRILFTAKAASLDAKKARNTILLHGFQLLLCMITYVRPMLIQGLLYLFSEWAQSANNIFYTSYVISQILPRFISPIVYGLRDQTFRRYLKRDLLCTMSKSIHVQTTLKTLQS